jgi:hypothetical protein
MAGPQAISLRLSDALYADGPRFSWLTYGKGIDALVSLPEDRLLYQDLRGLADGRLLDWTHHRSLRTIQGHKQVREVEVTAAGELTSWEGFTEAAARYGRADASLWACLIHDVTTAELAAELPRALVSTRRFADGFAALQAFRPRWHIEDDTFRELKEGWTRATALGTRFCRCSGAHDLDVLGSPVRESLPPDVRRSSSPDAPT